MLSRDAILDAVRDLEGLPPFPDVITRLEQELRGDGASVAGVARIVQSDPALASRFLATANSTFYSRGRATTSIQQAVGRLGLAESRRLAMASAMVGTYTDLGGEDVRSFWVHSIAVALTTKVMAQMARASLSEQAVEAAYVVGLLHDLGIPALGMAIGEDYAAVYECLEDGGETWAAELDMFGVEHGEVGALLAETWELPEPVATAVRYHHTPWRVQGEHRPLVLLVHLADFVCNNQGFSRMEAGFPDSFDDGAWEELGLSLESVPEIITRVQDEGERSETVWNMSG